jgi:hypothetical protein
MCVGGGTVRSIVACLVTLLAGCASQPPQRPATPPLQPVAGEAQTAIAQRAYLFVAVYQFEWEGHRYTLGNASDAQQRDAYSELVFIDGAFACARDRSMATLADLDSELTQWERVAQPGGLAYFAEQLRSTCASATAASPHRSSQETELTESSSSPVHDESGRPDGPRSDAELAAGIAANSLQLGIANPALLFVVPLALLAIGISNIDEAMAAKTARQQDAKWRSADSIEDVMKLLGKPVVEFSLPDVATKVLAYRLDDVHPYYVGLSDGKPIWFHNEYPWLHELAQQAIEEGKKR